MGNGIVTCDMKKKAEIIKYLSIKYEEYKHCNNYLDDEIKSKLIDDYNLLEESIEKEEQLKITLMKAEALTLKTSLTITMNRLLDIKANKLSASTTTKRPSLDDKLKDHNYNTSRKNRRRSFDSKHNAIRNIHNSTLSGTKQHIPSSSIKERHDIDINGNNIAIAKQQHDGEDHWDSVAAQPYCVICTMAFKTDLYLDRHVKYSDVHQRNKSKKDKIDAVKKKQQKLQFIDDVNKASVIVVDNDDDDNHVIEMSVEGIDYKLIYSGSKLFWRTREEVDMSFYIHLKLSIVEIISYDLQRNKDFKRIYMNHSVLCDLLSSSIMSKMDDNDEDKALSRYLISRMQLITVNEDKSIQFVPSQTDPFSDSLIVDNLPVHFKGVSVTRRRRTNGEEIEAMINSLEEDRIALCKATLKAQNISSVVTASVFFMATKKWWADFNLIRKKWIWAIRKVIRRRLVAEVTKHLLELHRKKIQLTTPYLHAAIDREVRRSFEGVAVY